MNKQTKTTQRDGDAHTLLLFPCPSQFSLFSHTSDHLHCSSRHAHGTETAERSVAWVTARDVAAYSLKVHA